jgi:hypothetical protein
VDNATSIACPGCGEQASGKFCEQCGNRLAARFCGKCGGDLGSATKFCGGCGSPIAGGLVQQEAEPKVPWRVAGVLSFLAMVLVLWSATKRGDGQAPGVSAATGAPPATAGTPPDLSTMTPREQFTRLNDRVMSAAQAGDSTTVIQFWPMAEQAYHLMLPGDRDIDAMYHMATLHLLVGRIPSTVALTDTIMAESPTNLLGWYLRGITAESQDDAGRAQEAQQAFLNSYESELATGRQEYVDHADILAGHREAARQQ